MKRFKEVIKKFVWGKNDVEHEQPPKRETKAQRAGKFIWLPGEVEHENDVKESLDEKFHLEPTHKGNFDNPHENPSFHPSSKTGYGTPEEGDESHEAFRDHHDNLSDEEKDSLRHYKSDGYAEINKHLRGADKEFKKAKKEHFKQKEKEAAGLKFKDDPEHHKHLKAGNKHPPEDHDDDDDEPDDDDYHEHERDDHIHHLDSATNHRTVEHHVVFRGGHPGDKTKFPIGHEFTDHGFISTSFSHHTAKGFSKAYPTKKDAHGYAEKKHKDHVHVIHVPKGSRGHYFDVNGEDSDHSNHTEKEFVLHRGTKFKVTHHSEDPHAHYIHSRIVKQGIRNKFNFKSKQKKFEPQPKDDHGLPGQHKFPFMKHHKRFK